MEAKYDDNYSPELARVKKKLFTDEIINDNDNDNDNEEDDSSTIFLRNYVIHIAISATTTILGQLFFLAIGSTTAALFSSMLALAATAILAGTLAFPIAVFGTYGLSFCLPDAWQPALFLTLSAGTQITLQTLLLAGLSSTYFLALCTINSIVPLVGLTTLAGWLLYQKTAASPTIIPINQVSEFTPSSLGEDVNWLTNDDDSRTQLPPRSPTRLTMYSTLFAPISPILPVSSDTLSYYRSPNIYSYLGGSY